MKYLVDTHILIWAFNSPTKLNNTITQILTDETNEIYYSQVSLWEIAIKYSLGKLDLRGHTPEEFFDAVAKSFFRCLTLSNEDLISSYRLPMAHRDPFDRMIIWQCIKGSYAILSADSTIPEYEKNGLLLISNRSS